MKTSHLFAPALFATIGLYGPVMALDFPVDRPLSAAGVQAATQNDDACLVVDKNRDLHLPCVGYKGLDYQFTLHPLINPIDPLRTIWKMDPRSLAHSTSQNCVEAGDDKRLMLPCVSFRGANSELVLNYHANSSDPLGHYWMNEPEDRPGGAAAIGYPEIYVVNDFARFQEKGPNTEVDTGSLFLLAANYFSTSSALDANNLTPLLVGQRTITNKFRDLTHITKGNEVDAKALLEGFAVWTETYLPQSGGTRHDAAILLTSLDLDGPETEIAYSATMCNASRAVAVVQATFNQAFDAASIARAIGQLVGMCNDPPGYRDANLCPTLPANLAKDGACSARIMGASRNPSNPETRFSACSAFDFNDWLVTRSPRPSCLVLPNPLNP